jgi:hypothetical protein
MPLDKGKVEKKQEEEIIDRTSPPGEVVYEAVYAEGKHELERNSLAFPWSPKRYCAFTCRKRTGARF